MLDCKTHHPFRCLNGKSCIDRFQTCDGVSHCPDKSDENSCAINGTQKTTQIISGTSTGNLQSIKLKVFNAYSFMVVFFFSDIFILINISIEKIIPSKKSTRPEFEVTPAKGAW